MNNKLVDERAGSNRARLEKTDKESTDVTGAAMWNPSKVVREEKNATELKGWMEETEEDAYDQKAETPPSLALAINY